MADNLAETLANQIIRLLSALYEEAAKADTPEKCVAFTNKCRIGLGGFCVDLTNRLEKMMGKKVN